MTFVFSRKFVDHGQIISQEFSVETKCKSELVFQGTPATNPCFYLKAKDSKAIISMVTTWEQEALAV